MCAADCFRYLVSLPPAQLLACQPHRLVAGACDLLAALPPGPKQQASIYYVGLGIGIFRLLIVMASHKMLSGRVRAWLASAPQGPASSRGSSSRCVVEEEQHDPCAGCLAAPIQSAVRRTLGLVHPVLTMYALALHKMAAGDIRPVAGVPCCAGGSNATGEADGGFQQCAEAMVEAVSRVTYGANVRTDDDYSVVLPDGSRCSTLFADQLDGNEQVPPRPPPSPPSGPLPPPLALPLSRGGVLTRLRMYMCGNPGCGNFAGESEGGLPLKQCGGCRAVRYCGADCQRAHWREGHRAECTALAAVVGGS